MKSYFLNLAILLIVSLHALTVKASSAAHTLSSYQIQAEMEQQRPWLKVQASIKFTRLSKDQSIELILNRSSEIGVVTSQGKSLSYQFLTEQDSPNIYIEDGKKLIIESFGLEQGEVTLHYSVPLESINYLSGNNTFESGLYEAWYPLNIDYGKFAFEVTFKGDTKQRLIGNGRLQQLANNIQTINNDGENIDIVLMYSNKVTEKTLHVGDNQLSFYSLGKPPEYFSELSKHAKLVLDQFGQVLGEPDSKGGRYQFVLVPRTSGPSYSRSGFAVIVEFKPERYPRAFRTVSHEIAHFWWNLAPSDTWQDWLNESFAEYMSLEAVKSVYGKEEHATLVESFQSRAESLPAIYQINRTDSKAQVVLYRKGPVLLQQLKEQMNESEFNAWLKALLNNKVENTKQALAQLPDAKHRAWLENAIKQ